ncbi:MAG: ribosomal-processing cysteine protease Prp [Lachnospiraceae bacterium]
MIKIAIYKNQKRECVGFKAIGHAGQSDAGQDVVCAAVSILMINTINAIEAFTSIETTMISDDEEGLIDYQLSQEPTKEATLLLKTMILGLEDVENDDNYKKYIDITFEEV